MTTNTAAEIAAIRERADKRTLAMAYEDRAALLAIVDALTARAEAAEAALRTIATDGERYNVGERDAAWYRAAYNELTQTAADALAAHGANGESAGNGGA